jgi:hypothetical protein
MNGPQLSRHDIAEMVIAILRATDDGDELDPVDLKLVELAINGNLNASGLGRLYALQQNATKPEGYTVPWLFGIEHLTIDLDRNICWKGVAVEHFDHGVWQRPGWREQMRTDAEAVATRCRELEAAGIQPTLTTATDW